MDRSARMGIRRIHHGGRDQHVYTRQHACRPWAHPPHV